MSPLPNDELDACSRLSTELCRSMIEETQGSAAEILTVLGMMVIRLSVGLAREDAELANRIIDQIAEEAKANVKEVMDKPH
jgi:hypothetical protein